jgi:hypothetical protein
VFIKDYRGFKRDQNMSVVIETKQQPKPLITIYLPYYLPGKEMLIPIHGRSFAFYQFETEKTESLCTISYINRDWILNKHGTVFSDKWTYTTH